MSVYKLWLSAPTFHTATLRVSITYESPCTKNVGIHWKNYYLFWYFHNKQGLLLLNFSYNQFLGVHCLVVTSVGPEPKLDSAWLYFGSSFWEKKLGLALLALLQKSSARLSSPYLAKKARISSACFINQKTELLWKTKNELIFNIFDNF